MAKRKSRRRRDDDSGGLLDSILFKFGTKMMIGMIIVVVFLTLVQCTVETPKSPSWNTNFTIPLTSRTYDMEELIEKIDQDGIEMDSVGTISYTIEEELDTIYLDQESLTTPDLSYAVSEALGTVDISPAQIGPETMSMSEATGLPDNPPGDQANVPPMSFTAAQLMPAASEYTSATIESGNLRAVVSNGLGLDLSVVTLKVYDVINADTIATQSIPGGVAEGATDSVIVNLDGLAISNTIRLVVYAETPGGLVTSYSTRYLATTLRFSTLVIGSGTVEVNPDTLTFAQQIELDESGIIDTATISTGQLVLTLDNSTAVDANLRIEMLDLWHGAIPMTLLRTVGAGSSVLDTIDLSTYRLVPADIVHPQMVSINVEAEIPGSGGMPVAVSAADSFSVAADLTGLSFSSVTGVFDSTTATFDALSESFEVPDGFDGLELQNAILTLQVENGVDLPGTLALQLDGDNGKQLNLNGAIARKGEELISAVSEIVNTDVADFLYPVPSGFDASGSVTFGDGVTRSTVTAGDFIVARVEVYAPLEFIIHETHVDVDPESQEIDQADIDLITDHVVTAGMHYNIVNHLPIGASVQLFLDPDSTRLNADSAQLVLNLGDVNAGTTTGGLVTEATETGYLMISLTSDDIQILKNPELFIATDLTLHDSEGETVQVIGTDYLGVTARMEIEYLFDGEF